jgi:hypothetical protein
MGQTRTEQETVIRWDEDDQEICVYSASPKTWRKCARLGLLPVTETRLRSGETSGKAYRVPVGQFRWGLKRKGSSRGNAGALEKARAARRVRKP